MPRTCTVCRHVLRNEIDASLIDHRQPVADVAVTFQLSESALRRHRSTHLPLELRQAHAKQALAYAGSLADQVHSVQRRLEALIDQAEASGDLRAAIAALREFRSNLTLLSRAIDVDVTVIEVRVMEIYVRKVVEILNAFVPAARISEALARLTSLGEAVLEAGEEVSS